MEIIKQNPDYHECPNGACSTGYWLSEEDGLVLNCTQCDMQYCVACKVTMHQAESCVVYQARMRSNPDELATQTYLKRARVKECPQCGVRFTKVAGCDHIRCEYVSVFRIPSGADKHRSMWMRLLLPLPRTVRDQRRYK